MSRRNFAKYSMIASYRIEQIISSAMNILYFHHASLPSTQTWAKEQEVRISPGELWVTFADKQTAGYGRRGSKWEHDSRDLAVTLSWLPEKIAIPSVLQCADLIRSLLAKKNRKVEIKWPNDLLFKGVKVGGLILEVHHAAHMGIGLDLGTGLDIKESPTLFAQELAAELQKMHFRSHKEISPLAFQGQLVHINDEKGIFLGINAQGAALLQLPTGETREILVGRLRRIEE